MASITLGSETDGSILCPSSFNSVVGIKPTLGLTSRSGVIPISPRQDSIGPICRTVSDALRLLDVIVGYDPLDDEPTRIASKFIPQGGYLQFLKADGLKGKRPGILRQLFDYPNDPLTARVFEEHFQLIRREGATVVDNVEIANASIIQNAGESGESYALLAEFKVYLNKYLRELTSSPVRSLLDLIDFNNNNNNRAKERIDEFEQDIFLMTQNTTFSGHLDRTSSVHAASVGGGTGEADEGEETGCRDSTGGDWRSRASNWRVPQDQRPGRVPRRWITVRDLLRRTAVIGAEAHRDCLWI